MNHARVEEKSVKRLLSGFDLLNPRFIRAAFI